VCNFVSSLSQGLRP